MRLAPGARIGPYEILAALGAGGMGEVYRARDPRLAREVAIKVLPGAFAHDANRLRRFEDEARAAGQLNHPNILTVHERTTRCARTCSCSSFMGLASITGTSSRSSSACRIAV